MPDIEQTNEKVAGYLQQYAAHFQRQIAKGSQANFTFPDPQNDDQRAALCLIVAEVIKKTIGMGPVRFMSEIHA